MGDWMLEVINDGRTMVELKQWKLSFFGTKEHPQPNLKNVVQSNDDMVELNQVPEVPEQKTGDVTNMHQGSKSLSGNEGSNLLLPAAPSPASTELKLDHCVDSTTNPDWCSECESGFMILNGRCVDSCPAEGYYIGNENRQKSCIQCYYSCKTCHGPNDYEV